jgi:hypothetical protein
MAGRSSAMRMARQPHRARPAGHAAPAHRRIFLGHVGQIGQHLVAADIERAEHHRPSGRLIDHPAIEIGLLRDRREGAADHEGQFGAVEADAVGAGRGQLRQIDQQAGIHMQRHGDAVERRRRQVAQRLVMQAPVRSLGQGLFDRLLDVLARPDQDLGIVAIDDDLVAGLDIEQRALDPSDHRNVERAGDDRDMRGRRAFLEHQRADLAALVIEQLSRAHGARDQHHILGQIDRGRGHRLA